MKQRGFTLIELLMFIVVSGILMSTLFLAMSTALRGVPNVHRQWIAVQAAKECLEWYLQQKRLRGYDILTCPSTPTASACAAPSGYSVSTNITCTTWNGDASYKTIAVTVSGLASATLSTQVGDS